MQQEPLKPATLAYHRRLTQSNHSITSPASDEYNCVAWAAGDVANWWWPGTPDSYWPNDVRSDESIDAFTEAFARLGYDTSAEGNFEEGFEKIAIYANVDGATHTARQLTNGIWTSKLGTLQDIQHTSPDDLSDDTYGEVALFMRRSRSQ